MTFEQDLPEHVKPKAAEHLIDEIADEFLNPSTSDLQDALEACGLQPTTRAAGMAARTAATVLLAHELGQTVAQDSDGATGDDTAEGDRETYELAMIEIQETAKKALRHLSDPAALRGELGKIMDSATAALEKTADADK